MLCVKGCYNCEKVAKFFTTLDFRTNKNDTTSSQTLGGKTFPIVQLNYNKLCFMKFLESMRIAKYTIPNISRNSLRKCK